MFILLVFPMVLLVAAANRFLGRNALSNLLARHLRSTADVRRSVVILAAMTMALLLAAHFVDDAAANGIGRWLNIVALVLAWDAIKFGGLAILMTAQMIGAVIRNAVATGRH